MTAKEALKLTEISSGLQTILGAIKESAKNGKRSLDLYEYESFDLGGYYLKIFFYNQKDLDEITKLGYIVKISHSENFYSGFLWWKKKIGQADYHTISW